MLPDAPRRKCTNKLKMIPRVRGGPGFVAAILVYLASSEEKTWMPGPTAERKKMG